MNLDNYTLIISHNMTNMFMTHEMILDFINDIYIFYKYFDKSRLCHTSNYNNNAVCKLIVYVQKSRYIKSTHKVNA